MTLKAQQTVDVPVAKSCFYFILAQLMNDKAMNVGADQTGSKPRSLKYNNLLPHGSYEGPPPHAGADYVYNRARGYALAWLHLLGVPGLCGIQGPD